jgi:beta-mannosidase
VTIEVAAPLRQVPLTSAAGVPWSVQGGTRLHPATVPGEVHTDLMAAGAIPDVFDGDNEKTCAWIGRTDWTYRAGFTWEPDGGARQELVAEGLDTVATVTLNGVELGRTANQHRTCRFDVTDVLGAGGNELVVAFAAPVDAAERLSAELGPRPHVNEDPYNAIRKMASNYGWDWGPDVATVGIWKPIRIESWSAVRIASVRPLATVDGTRRVLEAHVELAWADSVGDATVAVRGSGVSAAASVLAGQASVLVTAVVEDVDRWWPRGHGDQPLYPVTVEVSTAAGVVDAWGGRVGFRTVTLDVAPDGHGEPFTIVVNGEPVYVRGANWIPDDAFVTRLTAESYRTSIADAVDAGMNLLRVWGGGIYPGRAGGGVPAGRHRCVLVLPGGHRPGAGADGGRGGGGDRAHPGRLRGAGRRDRTRQGPVPVPRPAGRCRPRRQRHGHARGGGEPHLRREER